MAIESIDDWKKLFDITVGKTEKIVVQDSSGMFRTYENTLSLTAKDIPEPDVTVKTVDLQKQVKLYLSNIQVLDRLKSSGQVALEIEPYTKLLEALKKAKND
jgi:hypothetical protein